MSLRAEVVRLGLRWFLRSLGSMSEVRGRAVVVAFAAFAAVLSARVWWLVLPIVERDAP